MSASLEYDATYFRSISAILKISCLLCIFVGLLCILCSGVRLHNLRGSLYLAVALFACFCTGCSLLAGAFQLWPRKFYNFNVARYEMFLNGFLAVVTFVAAAVACSMDVVAYSVATFFGFFAACIYAYEAYLAHCLSRKCDVATQTQTQAHPRTHSHTHTQAQIQGPAHAV